MVAVELHLIARPKIPADGLMVMKKRRFVPPNASLSTVSHSGRVKDDGSRSFGHFSPATSRIIRSELHPPSVELCFNTRTCKNNQGNGPIQCKAYSA